MVLLLFFCSGATALVYEVVWSKYLSLMFGSTVQAQTVVLAVFMGGLALGNWLIGKRSDFLQRPLAAYGYFEIAIGLYAFFFDFVYRAADHAFVEMGATILEQSLLLLLFKALLATLLLIGPTILMGGTLPLLAAWLQKNTVDAGRRSARFYSVNSLGAVFGSFLAGFILVHALGLTVTLQMTALANVVIGALALVLSKRSQSEIIEANDEYDEPKAQLDISASPSVRRGCLMVALTGAVSMSLEVLAARGLSLIFGASLQAFAVVLMAFILGIGLGSATIASPRWRRLQSEKMIVLALLSAALWIALIVFNIEYLVDTYRFLKSGLSQNAIGFRYYQLLTALISLLTLGIPAGLLGSVLPLWIRLISEGKDSADHLGAHVGRLLTWNTIGAVVGVLLTGFVLMPQFGLRSALGIIGGTIAIGAMLVAWSSGGKRVLVAASTAVALACFTLPFVGTDTWRYVLNSGIFRLRETEVTRHTVANRRFHYDMLFYEDAADATVAVEKEKNDPTKVVLSINGKSDASSYGDLPTQYLCAHLPMLARPDATNVFVLGMGSGITAGALLGHPVQEIVVAENCEPVLRAAQHFAPWNEGVLTNSRARFWGEDARTILKLSPQMYDVVICEPSNPWTAGIGSVFSREFYQLASQRMKDDSVICQWFHIYEMNDEIVFLVLRTFGSVFPYFEIWEPKGGDLLLVGSRKPFASSPALYQRVFERDLPRRQLESIGLKNPALLLARQVSSQRTSFAIAGAGRIQSDNFPILEYEAPKAFYLGRISRQLFDFDERTWQMDFSPREKHRLLSALDNDSLRDVFSEYTTSSPSLASYLGTRLTSGRGEALMMAESAPIPCIFNPPDATGQLAPGENANAALLQQTFALLTSENPAQGVSRMKALLESGNYPPQQKSLISHLATRAIKIALRLGDTQSALELLKLGLKLNPESRQLEYLARILEREMAPVSKGL